MNIYDIATEAGVSISTVSRVLNNPDKVSRKTRERIQEVLRKYNYAPNAMARGLVHNSMKTIGIFSNNIRHPIFAVTAYVLEDLFFQWGYSSMLCNTSDVLEKKKKYIQILAGKKVDALVFIGSTFVEPELEEMIRLYLPQTPVVITNGVLSLPNAYSVLADHDHGFELTISHLISKGHQQIGMVNSSSSYNSQRKTKSFLKAMEDHSLTVKEENILDSSNNLEGGYDLAERFLKSKNPCTALIFPDDLIALGAVKRFKQLGQRVPEDVAVVGSDNSIYALCSEPTLTTIDPKSDTLATIVANTIRDLLSQRVVGTSIMLKPEFVVREST
jgi:LacI family transcriptional regulator